MSGVCCASDGAYEREVRKARPVQRLEGHDPWRRRDVRQREAIGEVGRARGEERHADSGHVLREAERHREQRVQEAEGGARQGRHGDAGPQSASEIHGQPPRHGAGREDPLDAEIEDARALAEERAQDPEHERGRDANGRSPETRREEDVDDAVHSYLQRIRYRVKRPLTSTHRSASATMRSAM